MTYADPPYRACDFYIVWKKYMLSFLNELVFGHVFRPFSRSFKLETYQIATFPRYKHQVSCIISDHCLFANVWKVGDREDFYDPS